MNTLRHISPNHLDALGSSFIVAAFIHALIILGVTFEAEKTTPRQSDQMIDVILLTPKEQSVTPEKADFLAPASQQGSASREGYSRPATPSPTSTEKSNNRIAPNLERSGAPQSAPVSRKTVVEHKDSNQKILPREKKPTVTAPPRTDINQLLASTQKEINRLTAELDRKSLYANDRPRRKTVNASTQEYRYASYLTAWRKKVERIGNLNYPDEAKRKKLYGDLLLHVAVRADGSVQKIRVVHSSGHQVLDDAAVRIVKLAAPFAPFPPEIRKETDIIDITRTWQFLSGNRLFTER